MKRIGAFLLLCALVCCLFGCTKGNYADVTPNCDAIQNICFQRTNIDENNVYTYFEKNIAEKSEVESLCASLDKIKFVKIVTKPGPPPRRKNKGKAFQPSTFSNVIRYPSAVSSVNGTPFTE